MSDDLATLVAVCEKAAKSKFSVTIDPVAVLPVVRTAATTLTEARAEIERLNAQVDEALRSCLAEREGRLKAEAAISTLRAELDASNANHRQMATTMADLARKHDTLRARVREVVGPFAEQADGARLCGAELDNDWRPFLHRTYTDVDITNGHLRAARQLMEDLKDA